MPEYQFSNPDNPEEIVSRFQGINDVHEYVVAGVAWQRIWTPPQLSMDIKIDPFSSKQFMDKTSNGGTMGDIWDRAADAAGERASKNGGVDPVSGKKVKEEKKSRDIVIDF